MKTKPEHVASGLWPDMQNFATILSGHSPDATSCSPALFAFRKSKFKNLKLCKNPFNQRRLKRTKAKSSQIKLGKDSPGGALNHAFFAPHKNHKQLEMNALYKHTIQKTSSKKPRKTMQKITHHPASRWPHFGRVRAKQIQLQGGRTAGAFPSRGLAQYVKTK